MFKLVVFNSVVCFLAALVRWVLAVLLKPSRLLAFIFGFVFCLFGLPLLNRAVSMGSIASTLRASSSKWLNRSSRLTSLFSR